MKKIIASLVFVALLNAFAQGQKADPQQLTGVTWLLVEDVMSGVGKHTPLDKDIHLDFSKDGQWKASQPMLNASSGTWQLNKKGKLIMSFGNKSAEITATDAGKLVIVYEQTTSKVTWKWEAAK